jgi:hypothetical protein
LAVGHFEREAKLMLWLLVAPLLLGLIATLSAVFIFGAIDAARIDQCQDRGGSYNHESGECSFTGPHGPGP